MDELQSKALAAADAIITEHGWPWNVNPDGEVETATEKSRLMLALGFSEGYAHGIQVMAAEADDALRRLAEDIRNA